MRTKYILIALGITAITLLLIPRTPKVEEVRGIPRELCVEPVIEESVEPVNEPVLIDLGEFKLTAYCSCSKCCGEWAECRPEDIVYGASGKELVAGVSVAVDTEIIPYGTVLVIDGREYEAMDCGGAVNGNHIDVYFNSHEDALEFGVQYANVSIREEEEADET